MAGIPAFQLGTLDTPKDAPAAAAVLITASTAVGYPVKSDSNIWLPAPVVIVDVGGGGPGDCDAVGYAG